MQLLLNVILQGVVIGTFCTVGPGVSLGHGCKLHPGSHVCGNTKLREGCEVMKLVSISLCNFVHAVSYFCCCSCNW